MELWQGPPILLSVFISYLYTAGKEGIYLYLVSGEKEPTPIPALRFWIHMGRVCGWLTKKIHLQNTIMTWPILINSLLDRRCHEDLPSIAAVVIHPTVEVILFFYFLTNFYFHSRIISSNISFREFSECYLTETQVILLFDCYFVQYFSCLKNNYYLKPACRKPKTLSLKI